MNPPQLQSIIFNAILEKPRCCVNSHWLGHVPFMITLVQVLKPKTFIELGTHNGCSFFAACQGAEMVGAIDNTHFLAVDSWEGDGHAGNHKTSVLKRFEYNINKFFPWANYRQDYFENVAPEIEDNSIDLLHIDGFHTYEAVKGDFDLWSPKVKEGGIILFHDTHEKMEDFGVWKFWDELKKEYDTVEFPHSHGLGVLSKGKPQGDMALLFEAMKDPDLDYAEVFEKASNLQLESTVYDFMVHRLGMKSRRVLKYIERLPIMLKR